MITKTATLVRPNVNRGTASGVQNLYRLDPPLRGYGDEGETHEYVVVSATTVIISGPETYIFGADADGRIIDWGELPGSYKGALDHEEALRNAGYQVSA